MLSSRYTPGAPAREDISRKNLFFDRIKKALQSIEIAGPFCGATSQTRTDDLRITNALLYRLSYSSEPKCSLRARVIINDDGGFVNG